MIHTETLTRLTPLKDIKDVLKDLYTPQELAKLDSQPFTHRTYKQIRQDYMDGRITHEEASRQLFKTHWQSDVIELNNKALRLWKEQKEKK